MSLIMMHERLVMNIIDSIVMSLMCDPVNSLGFEVGAGEDRG